VGGSLAAGLVIELIVQITDSHVGFGPGDGAAAAALKAAVDNVLRLDPAPVAVLFTGDLTEHGRPQEYERVRELIAPLPMPVHPLVGNHDQRDELRAAFSEHPGIAAAGEFLQYSAQCGPVRVVACDTVVSGSGAGSLDGGRLEWLEAELARDSDSPVIVAMHHPPVATGMYEFDEEIPLAAADREALAQIDGRVDLVVAGHIHLAIRGMIGARPVFVSPSVYLQAELDLRPGARVRLIPDPPGFGLHVHGADPSLISHFRPITPESRRPVD
jgi:3',5'-cyclic AMP phosphodiesterase CpdA